MNKKLNRAYIAQVAKKEITAKIENHFRGNYNGSEVDRAVALMSVSLTSGEDSLPYTSIVR